MSADLTMGALIACVILSGRTLAPLGQITNLLGRFNSALVAYNSLENLFSETSKEANTEGYLRHSELQGSIKLSNLSVTYPNAKTSSLQDINISVRSGEKIALLGRIGSGKTTLLRVIFWPNRK